MPATSAGMTSKLMGISTAAEGAAIYEKANGKVHQGRNRPRQDRRGLFAVAGPASTARKRMRLLCLPSFTARGIAKADVTLAGETFGTFPFS
jgi:hypothetical protein